VILPRIRYGSDGGGKRDEPTNNIHAHHRPVHPRIPGATDATDAAVADVEEPQIRTVLRLYTSPSPTGKRNVEKFDVVL